MTKILERKKAPVKPSMIITGVAGWDKAKIGINKRLTRSSAKGLFRLDFSRLGIQRSRKVKKKKVEKLSLEKVSSSSQYIEKKTRGAMLGLDAPNFFAIA